MQKQVQQQIDTLQLTDIHGNDVSIPSEKLTHIQFRRFAGCPVCNLHVHSFFKNADTLADANIQSVIVFHASKQRMLEHVVDLQTFVKPEFVSNFNLIADPEKKLYAEYGLENTWKSLLHPEVLITAMKGLFVKGFAKPERLETELVVPADFLINEKGTIVACKYGTHANDQWSVEELVSTAHKYQ